MPPGAKQVTTLLGRAEDEPESAALCKDTAAIGPRLTVSKQVTFVNVCGLQVSSFETSAISSLSTFLNLKMFCIKQIYLLYMQEKVITV